MSFKHRSKLEKARQKAKDAKAGDGEVKPEDLIHLKHAELQAKREADQNRKIFLEVESGVAGPVSFGDVVHLRHVRTGKFLDISTSKPALLDHHARLTGLSPYPKTRFSVTSPFKHISVGANVMSRDEVHLQVFKPPPHSRSPSSLAFLLSVSLVSLSL